MHKLYYSPGACSLAAHIVLEEIGEPYELELVSSRGPVAGVGTNSPEWKEFNPKARIPALSGVPGRAAGGNGLLTEAAAILIFLGSNYPQAGLLPRGAAGLARAIEWMNWLASDVHAMSYGQIWRAGRFSDDAAASASIEKKGKQNLAERHRLIEQVLSDGRRWAVADEYSVVDPYLLVFFIWGRRVGFDMNGSYPSWRCHARRVVSRPAVQRVLQSEEIDIGQSL